jgi:hypothetical protein
MTDEAARASELIEIRRARDEDVPAILELGGRSLGWSHDPDVGALFRWKHFESPFGRSPMWIATLGDRVVGLRTFLRWELRTREATHLSAVRAVDTATDPELQGRGLFTRLTTGALAELQDDDVQLVFNTPNAKSLPGYLRMGWTTVGRLPVSVMVTRARSIAHLVTARQPAGRSSLPTAAGEPASDALGDQHATARLLAEVRAPHGISTASSPAYLAWRYGLPLLQYRVMRCGSSLEDGIVVFRLRERGHAVEAAICEVLVPEGAGAAARRVMRRIARETKASYLLRLASPDGGASGFLRAPGVGPVLVCRPLDGARAPDLGDWRLALGDVELL